MLIDRAWIEAHIPHKYDMCLLEQVVEWDAQKLRARAISHRGQSNPLRSHDRLGAVCGVEYAAQAMAVHGALLASDQDAPKAGFLASIRNTELHVARLDDIASDLLIEVERFSGDANNILYDFSVRTQDRVLLTGRAAVVMNAISRSLFCRRIRFSIGVNP